MDDDVEVKPGWLNECIGMLKEVDGKYIATPVHQPRIKKWEHEPVNGYRRNSRTGSNCMVMPREVLDEIGLFNERLKVGKMGGEYANRIISKPYSFLITKKPMAIDLGFNKKSFNIRDNL